MDDDLNEQTDAEESEEYLTEEDSGILDEASRDKVIPIANYNITSFGGDYDVEGLVRRLQRQDIYIPPFQRDYVWTLQMASRFVESLLLGLPVPGVFLVREPESNRQIVIDGQQRLKTLQFFYEGFFNPKSDSKTRRVFKLVGVQTKFEGKTYETLETQYRLRLNDSIIHATIVKQESPEDDDTSMYHIFERLNNGGRKLLPQEMRTAIYHGDMIDTIKSINEKEAWREIFGVKHKRLKDQELILRFLALSFYHNQYERPMGEFLTKFVKKHQNASSKFLEKCKSQFNSAIEAIYLSVGDKAFRTGSVLNAAIFDSVMVGLSAKMQNNAIPDLTNLKKAYEILLNDAEFQYLIKQHTSDTTNVEKRIAKAIDAFSGL